MAPMLDYVHEALEANNIKSLAVRRVASSKKRGSVIDAFKKDESVSVLLLSAATDASGLTLVAAQRVFLLEPSLNPAVEAQAVNRVHRIGQTRPCFVHRFFYVEFD
eukprot:GABV01002533.1.p3 GENE.GABV01002533.1~~GABV01002533.1.p3  ORF type:complete len:106 (-),score=21.74 GABV01002533.1:120-437(-)